MSEKGKGKNREEYLRDLNNLEGLELVKAVAKSVYKKFRGYGLKSLGIDSLDEVTNVIYILYRENGVSEEAPFLSLFRDFLDYYKKSRNRAESLTEELANVLTDDYSSSVELKRDLAEYMRSLGLDYELFEKVVIEGGDPEPLFEERGLSRYLGYREIRRMKAKVTGFLTEY